MKRIHELVLVLLDAVAFRQGPGFDNLKDVEFLEADDSMDTAIALFTGEKFIPFDGGYERDARIVIEGDAPLPSTVLAIAPSRRRPGCAGRSWSPAPRRCAPPTPGCRAPAGR